MIQAMRGRSGVAFHTGTALFHLPGEAIRQILDRAGHWNGGKDTAGFSAEGDAGADRS